MGQSKFTDEKTAFAPRQAERGTPGELTMNCPRSLIVTLCCICGLLTVGCTTFLVHAQDVVLPDWARDRLPGTIGVYYSDGLRSYELRNLGDEFLLGESTIEVFDFQLERMFDQRVDLKSLPTGASPARYVDAVLSIDVAAAVFWFGNCTPGNPDVFKVAYEITLLSPEGDISSSWRTKGIGSHFCGGKLDVRWPRAREAMRLALQDAAEKLSRQVVAEFEARTGRGTVPTVR
jgi:hypothetical protein